MREKKTEEMFRIIKDLSNKLTGIKTKRRRPNNRNQNQFIRPFNPPQVLQREIRNDDQLIQTPINNENLVDNYGED